MNFLIHHEHHYHMHLSSLEGAAGAEIQSRLDMGLDLGCQPQARQLLHVLLQEMMSFLQYTGKCGLDGEAPLISVSSGLATSYRLSSLFQKYLKLSFDASLNNHKIRWKAKFYAYLPPPQICKNFQIALTPNRNEFPLWVATPFAKIIWILLHYRCILLYVFYFTYHVK